MVSYKKIKPKKIAKVGQTFEEKVTIHNCSNCYYSKYDFDLDEPQCNFPLPAPLSMFMREIYPRQWENCACWSEKNE